MKPTIHIVGVALAVSCPCAAVARPSHPLTAEQRVGIAEDLLCGPEGATGWRDTGPVCRRQGWDADDSVYRVPPDFAHQIVDLNVRADLRAFLRFGCRSAYTGFTIAGRTFRCIRDEDGRRWTIAEVQP